jgi:[ribosomal protein S5]-alanine N-acetyltransferase
MIDSAILPFPVIETQRLQMRQLGLVDQKAIFHLRSDALSTVFLGKPDAFSIDDAVHFIEKVNKGIVLGDCIYWGLTLKGSNQLIGTACIWNVVAGENKAEIGYELHPDYQGQGLIQEAVEEVIAYGFNEMELRELDACINAENIKSLKILERYHFRYVGSLNAEEKQDSEVHLNMVVYSLLASEYKAFSK